MPTSNPAPTTQFIGKPMDRVDGRQKVTGSAMYAADFPVKNVAYAVAFQSMIANGKIKSIDTSNAAKQPGVIAVLTHENVPKLYRVSMDHEKGKPGQTWLPLQSDEVHYAGQYIGVVIAETFTQALAAAENVKVSYDPQPPKIFLEEVLDQSFEPKKMGRGTKPSYARGDADGEFARAVVKIDQTYTTPIENHNPMELSATIASWDGDRLTLYDATQYLNGVKSIVSTWMGINGEDVRVIDPFVGGGFGCKGSTWPHEVLASLAAKHVNRPVKLVLTRPQMFSCIGYRPKTIQRVALGADQNGKLLATIHECTSQTSVWKDEWVEPATTQTKMLYSCPAVRTEQKLAAVNANTPTQMRAPGHATGTFALEVAMDELAYALKIDPIDLRLRNYARKDESEEMPFSSKALRECYRQGAEHFGWERRDPRPMSMHSGNVLIGWGMATATYPTNQQEASAKVQLLADGRAIVSSASHDLGTGAYTIFTQIAAETLGIPPQKVKVLLGDSSLPEAPVSGGSQTSASVGSAIKSACLKALQQVKERAEADPNSPLYQREATELAVENGRVFVKENPSTGEIIATLLQRNGGRSIEAQADVAPPQKPSEPSPISGPGLPREQYSKHAWGAQFAEVRINQRLGEIRVSRWVGAFAGGKILNAKTAHSQIMGGIVMGIGMGLLEHTVYDPISGKIVTDNLADYLVPVNADIPKIDCFFVDEPDEYVNPLGCKGVGELGVTGVAAAICNAVYHATGKRLRDLPITLDQFFA